MSQTRTSRPRQPVRKVQLARLLPVLPKFDLELMKTARLNGIATTARFTNAVIGLELELTIDRASQLSLTVHDPDYEILHSPLLKDRIDLDLGEDFASWRRWRLDPVRGVGGLATQDTSTILRFWDLGPAALKAQTGALRMDASKASLYRLVRKFCTEVEKQVRLEPVVPRPGQAPPKRTTTSADDPLEIADDATAQDLGFSPAAAAQITVKGNQADREQLANMNAVLERAVAKRSPALAVFGMVCANIGEALYRKRALNPDSQALGLFQLLPSTARSFGLDPLDVPACADQFLVHGYTRGVNGNYGAIPIARQNPGLTPGEIASKVEGSDQGGGFYDVHQREARRIIEAWSGKKLEQWHTVSGASQPADGASERRPAQWRRGSAKKPESSWAALDRYAEALGRRRFVSGGRLVMARDQDLILATPHTTIALDDPVIAQRPFIDKDGAAQVEAVDMMVYADGWFTPPGGVVEIAEAGPVDGPWLTQTIRIQAGEPTMNVTLTQPVTQPPPKDTSTSRQNGSDSAAGRGAEAAIKWAEQQIGTRETVANGGPKISGWQADFGHGRVPWCGIFCGKALAAAAVEDVPGDIASVQWIYDSAGARRHPFRGRTSEPNAKPGDLAVIYGTGTHVELVVRVNLSRRIVHTIGGNTSTPDGGEGVARKERSFDEVVAIAQVRYPE